MSEVVEKTKGFSEVDFKKIAEFVVDEHRRRQRKRKDREKIWKEIDRQIRMEPNVKYKRTAGGTKNKNRAWMPELEVPNQAQALEVLTADSLRMMFPDTEDWFRVVGNVDDAFLDRFDAEKESITGSLVDPASYVTQQNVDDLIHGFVVHGLKQFDHRRVWDLVNTDALKYGNGVARARLGTKPTFIHHSKGTTDKTVQIPILAPVSIKDVYLDDMENAYMADGVVLGPANIFHQFKKLEDVLLAAKRGSKDPNDPDGGWMDVSSLRPGKDGCVEYLEYEGDLVVPITSGKSEFIPNAIVTVAIGEVDGKVDKQVIRFRFRKAPYSSYINVPYHLEHIDDPYSTSPLMKGEPIQRAASEALNRLMQVSALNAEPPVKYSRDDQFFNAKGGPVIAPGAQWATEGDIETVRIGDPNSLLASYANLLGQFADVTGINAPRLGAQTVSHTTAFAKDQELQRGTVRTVDYVRSTVHGPMTRWLYMFYDMARDSLGRRSEALYSDKFAAFINVSKEVLPEKVNFQVYGSNGPAESMAAKQEKYQAIMTAIQINQLAVQQGIGEPLNYEEITKELLKSGGITDVDVFTQNNQGAPGISGAPQAPGDAGAAALLLQTLSGQG